MNKLDVQVMASVYFEMYREGQTRGKVKFKNNLTFDLSTTKGINITL